MIRKAKEKDLLSIVEMSAKFYPQTPYIEMAPFNAEAVAVLVNILIDNGIMLVAEVEGKIVGMVGLIFAPFIFEPSIIGAHEVVWWVEPEYNDKGIGKDMLQAIEPLAKAAGCQYIHMVCMANSPIQAAAAYIKLGYDHTEMSFKKRI